MKAGIHPVYHQTPDIVCTSCGTRYEAVGSTAAEFRLTICGKCHPYYTGEQKIVDTEGRVERLMRRYKLDSAKS
ncbi:MAG: 50S ribosomal protein L31 [SAR202 cluster bacterium]|nr:50S ribosomal protein L31 [SAR202 cluster bacterium]